MGDAFLQGTEDFKPLKLQLGERRQLSPFSYADTCTPHPHNPKTNYYKIKTEFTIRENLVRGKIKLPEFRMYTCSEPAQPYVAGELVTVRESGAGEGMEVRGSREG